MNSDVNNTSEYDYSYVSSIARVATYDDLKSAPRITTINPAKTNEFIEQLTTTVYTQAQNIGGSIPYTVVREVTENFIHAQFKEIVVSIFDQGNTIRFADQGPGISSKEQAQRPGFSSATEPMKAYIRGVGSGLPIVKEYLSISNGSITIEDNLTAGSVITISTLQKTSPEPNKIPVHQTQENTNFDTLKMNLTNREEAFLGAFLREGSLSVTQLSKLLGIAPSSVHKTLAKLETKQLIKKAEDKTRSLTEDGYIIADQVS